MWRQLYKAVLLVSLVTTPLAALDTTLVSQTLDAPIPWDIADDISGTPFVTADGQTAIFTSSASNLIPGQQSNPFSKPYRWNAASDEVTPIGVEPNADITIVSMSPNGQWIGLLTHATNLLSGTGEVRTPLGPPFPPQGYVLNTTTGEYQSVISRTTHVLASDDGSRLATSSLKIGFNTNHVFIEDVATETFTDITPLGNDISFPIEFSTDGTLLAFISEASNLAEPPTPIGNKRAYLYNFATQTHEILARDARVLDMDLSGDANEVVLTTNSADLVTGADATTEEEVRAVVLDRTTGNYSYLLPPDVFPISSVSMSADGRWVSFVTSKSLTTEDTNSADDVYLLDRNTSAVRPVTAGALQFGSRDIITSQISEDGTVVALNGAGDSYLYSIAEALLNKISSRNGDHVAYGADADSTNPQISDDGQLVTFISAATNLTLDEDDGGQGNVFSYARNQASVERIGTALSSQPPAQYHYALATASNSLVYQQAAGELRFHNKSTGIDRIILPADRYRFDVSSDGRFLAVSGTVRGSRGVFLVDIEAGSAQTIALFSSFFDQAFRVLISGDGNTVLFSTGARDLIENYPNPSYRRNEFFAWDRTTGELEILVPGGLDPIAAAQPSLSFDGRYVVFSSDACYQYDRETGFVTPVFPIRQSHCGQPDVSLDRRFMVFSSAANDLVSEGNVPDQEQLYIYDAVDDAVVLLTPHGDVEPRGAGSFNPTISADGSTIAFESSLESLTPDGNNLTDVFVLDNPFLTSPSDNESPTFTATLRDDSLTVDLNATWPDDAQFTQVREVDVPGGVLWEGEALSWTGEYTVPAGAEQVTFISRYFVDGPALGTTSITIQIENTGTEPPETEPPETATVPVANPGSASTFASTPVSIVLTGSDADGDSLAFTIVSPPAHGSLSGTAPNLMYVPGSGFVGSDGFSFTVSDGQNTSAAATVALEVVDPVDEAVSLLSAVLPASRSVEVGSTATAFATLINAGTTTAERCWLQLPAGVAAEFFYQTSNSATNEVFGSPNLPVDIPPGAAQSFVFGITPTAEMSATEVAIEFKCFNAVDASSIVGLNTLLLSAANTPVPDLIALAATVTNNGVMEIGNGSGFFTAATINVGSAARVSVTADTGTATLPMALSVCQTDPVTAVCINPTVPSAEPVVVDIAEGGTPTFAVFANTSESIALDPANSRVYLRLSDELGVVRGATSVAMQTTQ